MSKDSNPVGGVRQPDGTAAGEFSAFLSYCTHPDYKLAKATKRFLETFHRWPPVRRQFAKQEWRPMKICTDDGSFRRSRAGTETEEIIKANIREMLKRSAALILLTPGDPTAMKWQDDELAEFQHQNREAGWARPVFVVVTQGDPLSESKPFWTPLQIKEGLHEQIYFDFREWRPKEAARQGKVRDMESERLALAAEVLKPEAKLANGGTRMLTADELVPQWWAAMARHRLRLIVKLGVAAIGFALLAAVALHFWIRTKKELARSHFAQAARLMEANQSGKALGYLAAALRLDPKFEDARDRAYNVLVQRRFLVPTLREDDGGVGEEVLLPVRQSKSSQSLKVQLSKLEEGGGASEVVGDQTVDFETTEGVPWSAQSFVYKQPGKEAHLVLVVADASSYMVLAGAEGFTSEVAMLPWRATAAECRAETVNVAFRKVGAGNDWEDATQRFRMLGPVPAASQVGQVVSSSKVKVTKTETMPDVEWVPVGKRRREVRYVLGDPGHFEMQTKGGSDAVRLFSPDSNMYMRVLSPSRTKLGLAMEDGRALVFNLLTPGEVMAARPLGPGCRSVVFDRSEGRLGCLSGKISGDVDQHIGVWGLETNEWLMDPHLVGRDSEEVGFTEDGKCMVIWGEETPDHHAAANVHLVRVSPGRDSRTPDWFLEAMEWIGGYRVTANQYAVELDLRERADALDKLEARLDSLPESEHLELLRRLCNKLPLAQDLPVVPDPPESN
ncbi:hypothetical protein [Verrucomicrobium sp. BvORR106]|uniref:hypothetical protein n=1 Tax=Verrucomicrobium sp. BvORR106 TaxID=1403819 RepID=UPI00056E9DC8|nr:hypothetical protein [Verrucomicrobium sp. BvORR106]